MLVVSYVTITNIIHPGFLLVVIDNCLASTEPNTPPALTRLASWVTRPSKVLLSTGLVFAGEDARGQSTRVGS